MPSSERAPIPILLLLLATLAPPSIAGMEIVDLLESLQLHNTTYAGLQQKPGPHSHHPAALFSGVERSVYYSRHARDRVASLIQSSKEFAFVTSIRQQRLNSGTIFAFSYGKYQTNRYLELQSSGRRDELRLHYSPLHSTNPQQVIVETFPLRLADDSWHRLAVVVSGDQIEVLLDCRSVHRRVVAPIDTSFSLPEEELTLWLGQRNQEFLFRGLLQQPRLVAGKHGYLHQCPTSDTSCPTCGQFKQLEESVELLQRHVLHLTARLEVAESKLAALEQCECSIGCSGEVEGEPDRGHLDVWQEDCQACSCNTGKVTCKPLPCPPPPCAKPEPPTAGQCCPSCPAACEPLDDLTPHLTHGETFVPRRCTLCQCRDGSVECDTMVPELDCPKLDCDQADQITEEGSCCPVCREFDFCSGPHGCHEDASCRNGIFNYTCHCNQGFQGNGSHCDDVDECQQSGGRHGHHCPLEHARCINQRGSYACLCESGFAFDSTNTTCLPIDLCLTGDHGCHADATCSPASPGHHLCRCKPGFKGDGYSCVPDCPVSCQNGGTCVEPGRCSCTSGYQGANCQEDVNECLLGPAVHQCGDDSQCVNRPGWFYCACQKGFASYRNPLTQVTTCTDVDECSEGQDTCHPSATCRNTLGGYACTCTTSHAPHLCSTACLLEGEEHLDGSEWRDGCNICTCDSGRVDCSPMPCQCSEAGVDPGCCPECQAGATCPHQEIAGLTYAPGQRWTHNCMECECLHGEVDCWPLDCPPTPSCLAPVLVPGACCPSCPACNNNSSCGPHAGLLRQEGDSWRLPSAPCTSCLCKSGAVYCASVADCSAGGLPQEGNPGIYKALPSPLLPLTPSLSWREDIGPPESGHDALAANEIESEGVWGDSSRKPRRRRRRPKSKQSSSRSSSRPFTLSPEFVAKYISSPTPHTPIWDVSDP